MADYEFIVDGEVIETASDKKSESYTVHVGEHQYEVLPAGPGLFRVTVNGTRKVIAAKATNGIYYLDIDSVQLELREPGDEGFGGGAGDQTADKDKAYAPMPGKIVKVLVAEGQEVENRQALVIVEAMKMENQVLSPSDGTIKAINCQAGDQVDTETPLIELEIVEATA
jgi:biotin carboxyl carrier protein